MIGVGHKPELRDGNTIRAYLDELVLLKAPIQIWTPQSEQLPFETTIARIGRDTFTTTRTPPLAVDQTVNLSFLVDARRFVAATKVTATGVFRIPLSLATGERREQPRAAFHRAEGVEVFACERMHPPFLGGRVLVGRLVDLSLQGLRVALEDVTGLDAAPPARLQRGDSFAVVRIQGLPYTPAIQCGGIVAHVQAALEAPTAGFLLTGMSEADRNNIERILAPRFPATFGQAFPRKHRKTDLADQPGPPVATKEPVKAPEVVAPPPPPPPPVKVRPECPPIIRIRKAVRKVLVLSAASGEPGSLAQNLRDDDFKHVFEARSYLEAQHLARQTQFDIVLLDVRVGGHLGQMLLETLRRNGLLVDIPVILVADRRDASVQSVAEAVGAVHVHEKRADYEALQPVLYRLMA